MEELKKKNLSMVCNEIDTATLPEMADVFGDSYKAYLTKIKDGVRFMANCGVLDYIDADILVDYLITQLVRVEFGEKPRNLFAVMPSAINGVLMGQTK